MVNSFADAEDIVQETFLKWLTIDKKKIINTKSYLVKAVTNNCLNHLESLKKKKEDLFDKVNPRILKGLYREFDFGRFDLEFDISAALSVIHKKLKPLEKAIYLLREVFDLDYDNLNEIFDKSQENCRQLFYRAKEKLSLENIKLDKKVLDNHGILD
ncbi:MAG: sigma factor, partial [Bacteroidetes bacterium]|nr:sigma factor [Bacteroidota bacterium]